MRAWLPALARVLRSQRARSAPVQHKRPKLRVEQLEALLYLSAAPNDPDFLAWSQQTLSVTGDELGMELAGDAIEAFDAASRSLIGANVAQNYGYTGQGYTVAVIDTGLDYRHPALAGDYVGGWDFVDDDSDPMDLHGHGTHVAGIISSSNASYLGIAPDTKIVALRVLDANGYGTYGDVLSALQWVERNRAAYNIVAVNMSLGSGNYTVNPYTYLDGTLASLKNAGVFVAVASGNSYYSNGSQQGLGFPAISQYVVSVGAVWDANYGSVAWASGARDYSTAADRITSFTQRSSALDLLAPGAFITSSYLNGGTTSAAGTSMATPAAAAAAVLVHQALDATGQSARATPDGILQILQATGKVIIDGDDENDNVVNSGLSFKRVDLGAAIEYVQGNSSREYVRSLYVDILGRQADTGGLAYYTSQLQSGVARADVVASIWNSNEHLGRLVDGLYAQYLHRGADAGGRAYWVARMAGGDTLDNVALAMLSSAEYSSRFASNGSFVDALYRDVLGRNADSGGRDGWIALLNSGTSRTSVANAFLTSTERVTRVIDLLYSDLLGRPADQFGMTYYRSQMQSGAQSTQSLALSLLASDEYFARKPGLA